MLELTARRLTIQHRCITNWGGFIFLGGACVGVRATLAQTSTRTHHKQYSAIDVIDIHIVFGVHGILV